MKKDHKAAIDELSLQLKKRDELIDEKDTTIQQLTVALNGERRRKPASVEQAELVNAQLIAQQAINKKQEERITELTRLVTKLQKVHTLTPPSEDKASAEKKVEGSKDTVVKGKSSKELPIPASTTKEATKKPTKATITQTEKKKQVVRTTSTTENKKAKLEKVDPFTTKILSPVDKPIKPIKPPRTPKSLIGTSSLDKESTSTNQKVTQNKPAIAKASPGDESTPVFSPPNLRNKNISSKDGGTVKNK